MLCLHRDSWKEKMNDDILILGIESSCDETAASVTRNGREVLSNIISSQIPLHTLYGGVVPEIASRKHVEKIVPVIREALSAAEVTLQDIDAVAVTYGPGLVGALLVGVSAAKGLAYAAKKPLVAVHHIEGHVAANYLEHPDLEPPFGCLVVSGGHTHLVEVMDYGKFSIIGRTRDDAAGEAFDKVARAIGLGYPGGPKIDKKAKEGDSSAISFPKASVDGAFYDFSFSGLKSAVLNYLNHAKMQGQEVNDADLAASFQKAVVDVLTEKSAAAKLLLSPLMTLVKSTPVASFIILALLWLGRMVLPGFISALMVLPVVWANVSAGLQAQDPMLLEMAKVFGLSPGRVLRRITVPSLLVYASPGSIYTEETGRYVESQIPNTCFYRMENASHAFTPEQNERYLQQVCAFLQGTTDATRE